MTEDYISAEETEVEKLRLIELLKPELKTHGLIDLSTFVKDKSNIHINHTHSGFVRSLAYKIEEIGLCEVIPQKDWTIFFVKRNIYSKRHPITFAFILGGIGLIFSVVIGLSTYLLPDKPKLKYMNKKLKQVEVRQEIIFDSLSNLRNELKAVQDTLAKYK